jgi:hypothetical protein
MAGGCEDRCPIRIGDPCSLCHPGSSGPATCGLVYLVMSDPELREELQRRWARWDEEQARARPQERPATGTSAADPSGDDLRPGR